MTKTLSSVNKSLNLWDILFLTPESKAITHIPENEFNFPLSKLKEIYCGSYLVYLLVEFEKLMKLYTPVFLEDEAKIKERFKPISLVYLRNMFSTLEHLFSMPYLPFQLIDEDRQGDRPEVKKFKFEESV